MGKKSGKEHYTDFSNVEKMNHYIIPEEFPEGPFGSPFRINVPVENKSTEWKEGQRPYSNFNYEYKSLHEDLPRQMEGAHPPHDDPNRSKQPPYDQ
jgi:hypothetical protein